MQGLVLIDNYDSFTYNIVQYLMELGENPIIFENDKISIQELKKIEFDKIIISPGAGNPDTAGISLGIIKEFYKSKKFLGICLGHQCIAQFFGSKIIKAPEPVHGKISKIYYSPSCRLFKDIPQGFNATRYHSLIADSISETSCLKVAAQTKNGLIMALEHKNLPIYGVQFHPEAILSEYGKVIFKNFLSI